MSSYKHGHKKVVFKQKNTLCNYFVHATSSKFVISSETIMKDILLDIISDVGIKTHQNNAGNLIS